MQVGYFVLGALLVAAALAAPGDAGEPDPDGPRLRAAAR
jgi:hypothetical protein